MWRHKHTKDICRTEYVTGIRPGSFMPLWPPISADTYQKGTAANPSTLCHPESGINDSARNAANRSGLSNPDNMLPGSTFSPDGNRKCCHIMIKVSQMRSSPILQQMLNKDCLILTCVLAAIPLLEWKASKTRKWHTEGLFPFSFKTSGNSFRSLQIVFPHFSS